MFYDLSIQIMNSILKKTHWKRYFRMEKHRLMIYRLFRLTWWSKWHDMVMATEGAETDSMAAGVASLDWCGDDVASLLDLKLTWLHWLMWCWCGSNRLTWLVTWQGLINLPWKPAMNPCCCYLQSYSYSSIVQGCDLICCWLPLVVGRVNCGCGSWDGSGAAADLAEENDNYSVAGGFKELAF